MKGKITLLLLSFSFLGSNVFASPENTDVDDPLYSIKLAVIVALTLGVWQIAKEHYKKMQEKKKKNAPPVDDYIYNPNLSDTENQKQRFAQMNIILLEDLIKNKKTEYTEETYNLALEQYKLRSDELKSSIK